MKKSEPVSHIMSKNVQAVKIDSHLSEVIDTIRRNNIRHIPVMRDNHVVGIISSTDINRLTFGTLFDNQDSADDAVLEMLKIEQVMTSNPKVVSADTSIKEVAEIFSDFKYHALPVVESDRLVGIVTTTDVIRYLLAQY